jgi:hypothetical protein
MFRPGQKVACIVDAERWRRDGEGPHKGGVYVVACVREAFREAFLELSEFAGRAFVARGFRPIVEGEFERLRAIAADPKPLPRHFDAAPPSEEAPS